MNRCKPSKHTDVVSPRGAHATCSTCGDVFPCKHDCDHRDCQWVKTGEQTLAEALGHTKPEKEAI